MASAAFPSRLVPVVVYSLSVIAPIVCYIFIASLFCDIVISVLSSVAFILPGSNRKISAQFDN